MQNVCLCHQHNCCNYIHKPYDTDGKAGFRSLGSNLHVLHDREMDATVVLFKDEAFSYQWTRDLADKQLSCCVGVWCAVSVIKIMTATHFLK